MEDISVVIAEKDVIISTDIEDILRRNGFDKLNVSYVQDEHELKQEVPEKKPELLLLGDPKKSYDKETDIKQFLKQIVDLVPGMSILYFGRKELRDVDLSNPLKTLSKPFKEEELLHTVENWFSENSNLQRT